MSFLHGKSLTKKMRDLCRTKAETKIAIAYWGKDAIDLLNLSPARRDVRILCCLNGGKSDPDVVKKFGNRVRQLDNLHAKIIWTPTGAIVGSANASSNGLPEEEGSADGLIEAGIFVTDTPTLRVIEQWFNTQYRRARHITKSDLRFARAARSRRLWKDFGLARRRKRSLINFTENGR